MYECKHVCVRVSAGVQECVYTYVCESVCVSVGGDVVPQITSTLVFDTGSLG